MRTACHHKHDCVVVLMTTLFRAFFGGFFCWWCVKSSFAAFWKWVRQQMLLLVQVGEKLRASNCLLGSPSVRAELMAQTWLFALGICLWHTYSLLEHMLHACHSPRKRSGSETFTLTCSTFIAPMHQRVEVKKKKKKKITRSSSRQFDCELRFKLRW